MTLNVAIQMDPIESIDINADGTFRIVREAQERGHRLFYYLPEDLVLEDGRLLARGCDLTVRQVESDHFSKSKAFWKDLSEADVVWLRQDPPFDMSYVTTTHLLETVMLDTLVVNDPFWVRNYPEKLIVWKFPEIIPPTVIARNLESLRAFRAKHGDIIVKPLYGNGGAGVFFVKKRRHELQRAVRDVPCIQSRAGHPAEVPPRREIGRQARHTRRRRSRWSHKQSAGGE